MELFHGIPLPEDVKLYKNYTRYITFITSRPKRDLRKENNYNIHHILPKSMGGTNEENNLIKLTEREHFIAHLILWNCGYTEMSRAFWIMNNTGVKHEGLLTSRQFERLRLDKSLDISRMQMGPLNRMYGTHKTEEQKRNISEKLKGRIFSEEHKRKLSEAQMGPLNHHYGKKPTQETINKCRAKTIGQKRTEETKRKISEGERGKIVTQEQRERMSIAMKGKVCGSDNPFYGKRHTDETKRKISIANSGRKGLGSGSNPMAVPVVCIETNEYFTCQTDAAIKYYGDKKYSQRISKSILEQKQKNGYSWKIAKET